MMKWLAQLDELLRGDRTRADRLTEFGFPLSLRVFVPAGLALGATYGFFMGWYALGSDQAWRYWHALAVCIKLPCLFLLTLGVTFPSLYVFNALVGCRLRFGATLRLLVAAVVVNLAVGASLGPILGFFTLSTTSYPFMVLLNVLLLGIAGVIGLSFLLRTLRALAYAAAVPAGEPEADQDEADTGVDAPPTEPAWPAEAGETGRREGPRDVRPLLSTLQQRPRTGRSSGDGAAEFIFRVWVVIYAVVGMQMSWVLRPFIGAPGSELSLFRPRTGNFFDAVWRTISGLMGQ